MIKVVVLVLITVSFSNIFDNSFQYDDGHSIVLNPHIRSLEAIPNFFVDPSTFSGDPTISMYRPMVVASYAINYAISAYDVWSYHLFSLCFHMACALLIYFIVYTHSGDYKLSGIAAAIFAVHPIQSESVNYISSRSEILAVVFILSALCLHISKFHRWVIVFVQIACFSAGMLTKSVSIILPVLVAGYDVLILRRNVLYSWFFYLGCMAVFSVYLYTAGHFVMTAAIEDPVRSYAEQFWSQAKAVVWYIKLLAMPRGLNVDHQFLISHSLFDPIVLASTLFIISVIVVSWRCIGYSRYPLFLLLWAGTSLIPASIVPLNVLINEHRVYLAHGSFAVLMAWGARETMVSYSGTVFRTVIPVILIVLLSAITFQRNRVWESAETLWLDAASKAPMMARPLIMLADEFSSQNRNKEAITALKGAMERDPGYVAGYGKLAQLLATEGNLKEAARVANEGLKGAVAIADRSQQWGVLGEIYRREAQREVGDIAVGLLMKSREAYLIAIELTPDVYPYHDNLGNVCQLLNRPEEALGHHRRALELNKTVYAYVNIGNAFQMMAKIDSSIKYYRNAIHADSTYAGAWANLGVAYQTSGNFLDAQKAFGKAAVFDGRYNNLLQRRDDMPLK